MFELRTFTFANESGVFLANFIKLPNLLFSYYPTNRSSSNCRRRLLLYLFPYIVEPNNTTQVKKNGTSIKLDNTELEKLGFSAPDWCVLSVLSH